VPASYLSIQQTVQRRNTPAAVWPWRAVTTTRQVSIFANQPSFTTHQQCIAIFWRRSTSACMKRRPSDNSGGTDRGITQRRNSIITDTSTRNAANVGFFCKRAHDHEPHGTMSELILYSCSSCCCCCGGGGGGVSMHLCQWRN